MWFPSGIWISLARSAYNLENFAGSLKTIWKRKENRRLSIISFRSPNSASWLIVRSAPDWPAVKLQTQLTQNPFIKVACTKILLVPALVPSGTLYQNSLHAPKTSNSNKWLQVNIRKSHTHTHPLATGPNIFQQFKATVENISQSIKTNCRLADAVSRLETCFSQKESKKVALKASLNRKRRFWDFDFFWDFLMQGIVF
jgi:hypothetical protein